VKFYVRKFSFYLITLWAAITLNFLLPRLLPGDPAKIMLAKLTQGRDATPAMIKSIERLLGGTLDGDYDVSLWQQYLEYWGNIFKWDLGVSLTKFPEPVTGLISSALPWTITLVGLATIISFLVGIAGGAWIGWKRGTWVDHIIPGTTLMQSVPYFWLAMLLVFLVGGGFFPTIYGYDVYTYGSGAEWSWGFAFSAIRHGLLPAATIVLSSVGGWLLGMRNMMVSTLSEDYITTAEAKGLRPRRILMAYTVRNAVMPSIAGFAITLGFVVAGSVVMEQVFTYPGVGKLLIQSVQNNDYALMQGVFLVITLSVLVANFLMDMFYGLIDPRARHNA